MQQSKRKDRSGVIFLHCVALDGKNVFCADKSQSLSSFTIDSNAVKDKLCKLKNNKAPGIDSVGSKMLIEIADEISVFFSLFD